MKRTGKFLVALLAVVILLTSMTALTASAAQTTEDTILYLTPNANWKQDNARFALYTWDGGDKWFDMTDSNGDGIYECTIPAGIENIIFCRMNPSTTANNWNNKWDQTVDLKYNGSNNHYTVAAGAWSKGSGTWSTISTSCAHANLGSAATCTEPQICLDCGDPVAPATGHASFDSKHICTVCGGPAPFTVAGTGDHLGTSWDVANTANDLTYADGVWTKVYENVAKGTYSFKVARNHDWGTAYPGSNKSYTVSVSGSTVTITFDGVNVKVDVKAPDCSHTSLDSLAEACTTAQICGDCGASVVLGHKENENHYCTRCETAALFTVVGTGAHLGAEWDPSKAANDMTYADGVYTKVYENVAAGSYELKVARDHKWDVSYPAGGNVNETYTVETNGSTVTVTLTGTTIKIDVEAPVTTCLHTNLGDEATCTTPQVCNDCGVPVVSALGHSFDASHLCTRCNTQATFTVAGSGAHLGTEWDTSNTANDMTYADGVYTKVYENVAAGSYAFKVVRDHDWGTAYPANDKSYTVSKDGSTVTITLTGTEVEVTVSSTCDHIYVDGVCSECGELDLENTVVIYFENNWNWPVVYFHYWYDGGINETWPGEALTNPVAKSENGYDIYEIEIPVGVSGFIFNGTGEYGEDKSNDITEFVACNYYYMLWDTETETKIAEVKEYHIWVGADCVTPGVCSVCQAEGEALGHDIVTDAAVAPTCTETGLTAGEHCTRCDHVVAQEVVDALGHTWVEADCDTPKTCSVCGETEGEALGHTWVDADCETPKTCSVCGETEGEALGHTWVEADCVTPKTCSVCNKTEGEALGHAWGEWITDVEPTEEEDGEKHRVCGTCGENETGIIPSISHVHNHIAEVTTAPTCEAEGVKTFTCRCGDTYTEAIPATGHTEVADAAVAPTCEATGLTAGSHCEVCDKALVAQEVVPALGHDMVVDAAVAPTCEATGLTEGSHCTRCDHKVAQEEVPALGHDIVVDAAVDATCTETGLTEGEHCTRCDHKVAQEEVPALGHDIVTDAAVAPTCTETGLTEGEHCTRCDYKVAQEVVPGLGHNMVVDAAVAPTCDKTGLTEGSHCTRCDHKVDQKEVPATGHSFVEGKCHCGAEDPDYVAPNLFQRIWTAVVEFFKNIISKISSIFPKK